jgi:hypothetical protein
MPQRRSSSWRIEVFLVLGAIACLGVLAAPLPFTGDQALFAAGARQIARGDVLYRDFWDVKQPGIYIFYLTGGTLFGYSEVALHLFELAYQLVFAVVLIVTLRNVFRHPWIGPLVALLIFGTYYATIEPVSLGQVESLVGLPLYLTLWCSLRALGGREIKPERIKHTRVRVRWLFASGLFGAAVLLLKLVLAPVVGGIWLLTAWELARAVPKQRWRAVASTVGAVAAGVLIPIAITTAYLAKHGQLGTVRWTYFTVTSQATAIAGRPISRLVEGGFKTGVRWALPLALAVVAVLAAWRRGWDRLQVGLVAWIVLGVPVFLVQHWWIYTYAMFLVPVGILAGYGLDEVVDRWSGARRPLRLAVLATAIVLLVPAGVRFAGNGRDVARHDFALTTEARAKLRFDLEPDYWAAAAWASWLRQPTTPAGGVYVMGNPLDLYLSNREQTVAVNGWSPEQYPDSVWARLRQELKDARPVQVVVDRFSDSIMRQRSPETRQLIAARYKRVGHAGPDSWYQLRTLPAAG